MEASPFSPMDSRAALEASHASVVTDGEMLSATVAVVLVGGLGDHAAKPAVGALALVVAGFGLWRSRRLVPRTVPHRSLTSEDLSPARDRTVGSGLPWLVLWIAVMAAACWLVPDGAGVFVAWGLGELLKSLALWVRVRRWQRRHERTLVWQRDDSIEETFALVLRQTTRSDDELTPRPLTAPLPDLGRGGEPL